MIYPDASDIASTLALSPRSGQNTVFSDDRDLLRFRSLLDRLTLRHSACLSILASTASINWIVPACTERCILVLLSCKARSIGSPECMSRTDLPKPSHTTDRSDLAYRSAERATPLRSSQLPQVAVCASIRFALTDLSPTSDRFSSIEAPGLQGRRLCDDIYLILQVENRPVLPRAPLVQPNASQIKAQEQRVWDNPVVRGLSSPFPLSALLEVPPLRG